MSYLNDEADTAADASLPWVHHGMGNPQVAGMLVTSDSPNIHWQMRHIMPQKENGLPQSLQ